MPISGRPPRPETLEKLEQFQMFRGGFLSDFAQSEFMLGRLVSRLHAANVIKFDGASFPFSLERRLNAVRKAFQETPTLNNHREAVFGLLDRLEAQNNLRRFLAHGFASFDVPSNTWQIRMFTPQADNMWHETAMKLITDELPQLTAKMGILTQEIVYRSLDMSEEFNLNI